MGLFTLVLAAGGCAPAAERVLVATYFLGNGESGVYLAVSRDGETFEPLVEPNIAIMTPNVGKDRLMRDAHVMLSPEDDRWHMVWTTGWWDRGFGLAHSDDLVHWSMQRYVEVLADEPNALNCWAPEMIYDDVRREYMIFWSSTITGRFAETEETGDPGPSGAMLNHRIYYTTTTDFEAFSRPALLYDPGYVCIDATMMPPIDGGGRWRLFFKDETLTPAAKNIRCKALRDPRVVRGAASAPITGAYWAEGPSAVRLGGGWRVYFDRYVEGRYGAVDTNDFVTWTDVSARIRFPEGARHGTVVWVDGEIVEHVRRELRRRRGSAASTVSAEPVTSVDPTCLSVAH